MSTTENELVVPASTFPAIVGSVLQQIRKQLPKGQSMDQKRIADALGMKSISAWSKVENGETALTVEQLALACAELQVAPSVVLRQAEDQLIALSAKGVRTLATRSAITSSSKYLPVTGAALAALLPIGPIGWIVGGLGAGALAALASKGKPPEPDSSGTAAELERFAAFKAALSGKP